MIIAAIIILLVLVTLFTAIQTLYLEGMRLRTRDLPHCSTSSPPWNHA